MLIWAWAMQSPWRLNRASSGRVTRSWINTSRNSSNISWLTHAKNLKRRPISGLAPSTALNISRKSTKLLLKKRKMPLTGCKQRLHQSCSSALKKSWSRWRRKLWLKKGPGANICSRTAVWGSLRCCTKYLRETSRRLLLSSKRWFLTSKSAVKKSCQTRRTLVIRSNSPKSFLS